MRARGFYMMALFPKWIWLQWLTRAIPTAPVCKIMAPYFQPNQNLLANTSNLLHTFFPIRFCWNFISLAYHSPGTRATTTSRNVRYSAAEQESPVRAEDDGKAAKPKPRCPKDLPFVDFIVTNMVRLIR